MCLQDIQEQARAQERARLGKTEAELPDKQIAIGKGMFIPSEPDRALRKPYATAACLVRILAWEGHAIRLDWKSDGYKVYKDTALVNVSKEGYERKEFVIPAVSTGVCGVRVCSDGGAELILSYRRALLVVA